MPSDVSVALPWLAGFPRFPLLDGPSPLQSLPRFGGALRERGAAANVEVWTKREDLLPLAFGGNKLRNLEFLVGEALALGADTLVTSGRRWSNHCRLTAAAAVVAGLDCHVVLSGPPIREPGPGHRLMAAYGATIRVTGTDAREEREALVERACADLRAAGARPYIVGVGGSSETGALGHVLAGIELTDQVREAGVDPVAVVVPSATGGTQAGLIVGTALAALDVRIVGMAVARPPDELRAVISDLAGSLAGRAGLDISRLPTIELRDARGPGYGRRWSAADDAASVLARSEAILADPIYTAKGLAGLIEMSVAGDVAGPVVFWHGGGTPGMFEQLDP